MWLHHLDINKALWEKVRWELHKDTAYHFQQILEVTLYKTAAVWPLTSHLINHPSKMNKIWWLLLRKQLSPMDTHVWSHQCWLIKTYIYQLCVNTGCRLEEMPRMMDNRDGWWERGMRILQVSEKSKLEIHSFCFYNCLLIIVWFLYLKKTASKISAQGQIIWLKGDVSNWSFCSFFCKLRKS